MKYKSYYISLAASLALSLPVQAGSHQFGGGARGGASFQGASAPSRSAPARSAGFARGGLTRAGSMTGPRFSNGRFNSGGARVVARQSASAHPNWSRNHDHFWHGHRCRFVNGSWVLFDFGYDPFFWGYPYGYGYGYPYNAYYPYDSGVYDGSDAGYQGSDSRSYDDNGSPVAVMQARLKRLGYYRGRVDGEFGPATRRAIAEYQREHGQRGSITRNNSNGYPDRD